MKLTSTFLLSLLMTNTYAIEGVYKLDPSHAKVGFEVSHLVISNVEGKFTKLDGELTAGKKLSDLKINANVDITSIKTEDSDRDKHLLSPDFFDVEKFPKMTFASTSVSGNEGNLTIKGKLTIKAVTKDVTFKGKLSKEIKDPWGNLRVAITGKTTINRQDFGLTFNKVTEAGPIVGNDVVISLSSEAIKQK